MNIWFWFYIHSTPSKQEIYFERTVFEKTDHIGGPHFFRGQDTDVKIFWYDVIVNFFFFLTWRVSLAKCSYWYKFHVNIIAGSGVMTIFNYKGLTRNPEIGNSSIWVFPNIWRLGQVRDTKFNTNTNVSNEMLLNAVKCQV